MGDSAARNAPNPWPILKADAGDVVVFAMCVPVASTRDLPKHGEFSFGGARTVVEIRHRAWVPTETPTSEWSAWIAWRGHRQQVRLDAATVCTRCGQLVEDVVLSPEGLVLIGH